MKRLLKFSFQIASLITVIVASLSLSIAYAGPSAGDQTAAVKTQPIKQRTQVTLRLRGSNGYRITIHGSSKGVSLVATKRHSAAEYIAARGHSDDQTIEASFGRLGAIRAKFVPHGNLENEALPEGCKAPAGSAGHFGSFLGRIEFHGEEGFTDVETGRAKGTVIPSRRLVCKRQVEGAQKVTGKPPSLVSFIYTNRGSTSFWAGGDALSHVSTSGIPLNLAALPKKGIAFSVRSFSSREGVDIMRVSAAKGPPTSFVLAGNGTTKLSPPSPFSGTSSFDSCDITWRGSLTVSLPGERVHHLASPGVSSLTVLRPPQRCS